MWKCYGKNSCGNNITNKEKSVVSVFIHIFFFYYFDFYLGISLKEPTTNKPTTTSNLKVERRRENNNNNNKNYCRNFIWFGCKIVVGKVFPSLCFWGTFVVFLVVLYFGEKLRVCLHFSWGGGIETRRTELLFCCWLVVVEVVLRA